MAKYTATFSVAGVNSAANVLINLMAGSRRVTVLELGVFIEAAPSTAPLMLVERMTAVGTGTITSVSGLAHDSADAASASVLESAWATTKPTVSGSGLRRVQLSAIIGSGFIWDFTSRPLIVPASGGLSLVQQTASGTTVGTIGGYIVWDE